MSHVDSVTPPGPVSAQPGQTLTFDVDVEVPQDAAYMLQAKGDDGVEVTVSVTVDRPSPVLVLGGSGTLAPHEARITVTGGTLAAVPGQPTRVAWTLPG